MNKKTFLIYVIVITIIAAVLTLFLGKKENSGYRQMKVTIKGQEFVLDVADTDELRGKGLSGRPTMGKHEGMIFIFDRKEKQTFWMNEMKFPLDFIWIDGNEIVDITQNVHPPKSADLTEIELVSPKEPADKVIEVNAGTILESNIKTGDIIEM